MLFQTVNACQINPCSKLYSSLSRKTNPNCIISITILTSTARQTLQLQITIEMSEQDHTQQKTKPTHILTHIPTLNTLNCYQKIFIWFFVNNDTFYSIITAHEKYLFFLIQYRQKQYKIHKSIAFNIEINLVVVLFYHCYFLDLKILF